MAPAPTRRSTERPSGRPAPKVRPDRSGPMHAEIVSVGRELLTGQVADRNARQLARFLTQHGALVQRITVVGDDEIVLADALRTSLGRNPHLLITTGGLGPAGEDATLSAISRALVVPLALDRDAKDFVESAYRRLAEEKRVYKTALTAAREKMCRLPVGSVVVPNPAGVAPGVLLKLPGGAVLLALPGRPEEMEATLGAAAERLKLPRRALARREVEAPTADEAALRPMLDRLIVEFPSIWIASRPASGEDAAGRATILLEAIGDDAPQAESAAEIALRRLLALAAGSP